MLSIFNSALVAPCLHCGHWWLRLRALEGPSLLLFFLSWPTLFCWASSSVSRQLSPRFRGRLVFCGAEAGVDAGVASSLPSRLGTRLTVALLALRFIAVGAERAIFGRRSGLRLDFVTVSGLGAVTWPSAQLVSPYSSMTLLSGV